MPNLSDSFADSFTTHSVDLLRVSESLREKLLQDLEYLELDLIADLQEVTGKTDFTLARLRALLTQTRATIATAYDSIGNDSITGLEALAKAAGQLTTVTVNAAVGVDLLTVAISPENLAAIASDVILFGKIPGEWWKDQDAKLADRFAREMRIGQYRGETIDQLVRRVRGTKANHFTDGIMQVPKNQAEALVRTGVLGVANEARAQTLSANRDVIKGVQWISTLDSRTTEICMALDGLSWDFPKSGDGYADYIPVGHDKEFSPPPAHWNCRSTIIPITYSYAELAARHGNSNASKIAETIPEGTRASMDGQIAEQATFEDWLTTKDTEFQNEVLGEKVADLWRSGQIEIPQLTNARNVPLTINELLGKYALE